MIRPMLTMNSIPVTKNGNLPSRIYYVSEENFQGGCFLTTNRIYDFVCPFDNRLSLLNAMPEITNLVWTVYTFWLILFLPLLHSASFPVCIILTVKTSTAFLRTKWQEKRKKALIKFFFSYLCAILKAGLKL